MTTLCSPAGVPEDQLPAWLAQAAASGNDGLLLAFRQHAACERTCRAVLEAPAAAGVPEEARFHAALALCAVTLERWGASAPAARAETRQYCWRAGLRPAAHLTGATQRALLGAGAAMYKRGFAEDPWAAASAPLWEELRAAADDPSAALAAVRAAEALVAAFRWARGARAVSMCMPLAWHAQAHAVFEVEALGAALELGLHVLCAAAGAADAAATAATAAAAADLCSECLGWDFGGHRQMGGGGGGGAASGRGSVDVTFAAAAAAAGGASGVGEAALATFRRLLVRPEPVAAVCALVEAAPSADAPVALAGRQLLVLLASLRRKEIFGGDAAHAAYANCVVERAVPLLERAVPRVPAAAAGDANAHAAASEVDDACALVCRVALTFPPSTLAQSPAFGSLCRGLAGLTSALLDAGAAASEAALSDVRGVVADDAPFMNSYALEMLDEVSEFILVDVDDLVEAWGALLQLESAATTWAAHGGALTAAAAAVFGRLVDARAHMACAAAAIADTFADDDGPDVDGLQREALDASLLSAAALGRAAFGTAAAALLERFDRGGGLVARLRAATAAPPAEAAAAPPGHQGGEPRMPLELVVLSEELHFVVLCVGHLVTDDNDGERPEPPLAVAGACAAHPDTAGRALVELCSRVLSLMGFELERIAADPNSPNVSPYLSEALLWFARRWARSYLLVAGPCGPAVSAAYDAPQASAALAETLLGACRRYLQLWPSQPGVANLACDTIAALAAGPVARAHPRLPAFVALVGEHAAASDAAAAGAPAGGGIERLGPEARQRLAEVLCGGAIAADVAVGFAPPSLFEALVHPLHRRLARAEAADPNRPSTAREVRACAALFGGVARGDSSATCSRHVGSALTPALEGFNRLLRVHREKADVVHAILALFRDYAEAQIMYLGREQTHKLFCACGEALQVYAGAHLAAAAARIDALVGESGCEASDDETAEVLEDLLCVVKLLSHLASKDLLDLASESGHGGGGGGMDGSSNGAGGGAVRPAEDDPDVANVVFFGLSQLIPHISERLLSFPSLCAEYCSLVCWTVESYASRLAALPHALFMQLVASIGYGCKHTDPAVARSALRALSELLSYHAGAVRSGEAGVAAHLAASPALLAEMTRTLLGQLLDAGAVHDRLPAVADAVLALLVCDPRGFEAQAGAAIQSAPPGPVQGLLQGAFHALVTDNGFEVGALDRLTRRRFARNCEAFVKTAHSLRLPTK